MSDVLGDARVVAVQRLYHALAAGDRETIEALLHPEFVGHAAQGLPLDMGGRHVGADSMCTNLWWRIGRHFSVRAVAGDFQPCGDGRLMVTGRYRGTARSTGRELDAEFIHLFAFAPDGRISTLHQLTDTAVWCAAVEEPSRLETIDYRVDGGVATICLNRPDDRNAIDLRVARETLEVARLIAADDTARSVLICGDGPSLSVGGDIGFFLEGGRDRFGDLFVEMTPPFHQAFAILSGLDVPIVTAAHGAVAGGGLGYVYAADLVIAAEGTRFVTAFAGLGVSGDGGGTWHLPRLIGARRAAAVYLRNTPISAEEALDWGLINEIVPGEQLRQRAVAVAVELAHGPTKAFATMRRLLRESWHNDLPTQLVAETQGLRLTGDTADAAAAIAAFAVKTRPEFTGR
ncbi:enoyl-CoA hydratase-related protein [Mycobacterium sp. CVI_P3]|uniref:Enoyl-CoA hydratase-related protein n=1 Tax=Mycobacterium pinniadriaticum TaxID=2994102 RepID=A0ABT3SB55_9MYCO|nr:enoyl-CoA hydratase-related protein [Mycobacterium pinniadriaticum]MCX2929967.1 enoyl-CoA hydratase-related protein [Mycobacterium pinniadriaticum]MCX2936384.1 enoyl-CoA hydratase-related protein [Mycobacterium pinniadriaticum]